MLKNNRNYSLNPADHVRFSTLKFISGLLIAYVFDLRQRCIIEFEMFELPLFPLNTVLFPGMSLPLHIFESRYQKMIRTCLEVDNRFGVVLIKRGSEALGPLAEPYMVGCTALITDVQSLDEGRMNITTIGEQRFRVHNLNSDLPYLVGEVEFHPLLMNKPEELQPAVDNLTPKIIQYIRLLNQIEEVYLDPENLPEDPIIIGYFAAALLQMPPNEKQALLQSENYLELLDSLNRVYIRETSFLRATLTHDTDQTQISYSQN
jgi:Lon protease-like protein